MSSRVTWKTGVKLLALAALFFFLLITLISSISIPKDSSFTDRVNVYATSISKKGELVLRIKMPRGRTEKLRINGTLIENKTKEFLHSIPLSKTNDWPFYKYEYNIHIEDVMTNFRYFLVNNISNVKITDLNISSDNSTKAFVISTWVLTFAMSFILFIFVSEVWLRRVGGTVLQLIFCLGCTLYSFLSIMMVEIVAGSFFVNDFVSKWSFICNLTCLCLMFGIFVFRFYNEKFVNGVRQDNEQFKQVAVV